MSGGKKKAVIKSRNKKENHVCMIIKGGESRKIGKEIRAALAKMECCREISYCIITKDFHQ